MLAFLGLCVDSDIVADSDSSLAHPEQIAFFLVESWLKLLNAARADPAFGNLFKPRPFANLVAAARTNPVVMLNLWGNQCDALILRNESQSQPLEDPTADPPRLTWCLTGPTAFFPLHAAGLYVDDTPGTKAFEFVASSYTPTLSILADANNALTREPENPFMGVLAVSLPHTPGLPSIPNTVTEVEALHKAVQESDDSIPWQWLNSAAATKAAVLEGMKTSSWVHLACHARQYPLNASESAFVLADGETLSLADVGQHASAGGELAFLSACQTASGDADLSEEGVHLAAGMLVAGYRSVIASAWSVGDRDARDVSEAVYRRLLTGGRANRTGAALALHHATQELREKLRKSLRTHEFLRWAPFIHLGI
ncbi:CHAT domain-containing protein [Vararia minispora EC-137]|uniref:CHAT domain-containing protein n=1 Tax=Vararia minispora EC-137 TaxID=1314806 RepID=A0ACB8QEG3_9AGAM|nr:CHAT domain-containing protein [Vararia minispora EC-137]